jgi:hypothetical protein
VKWPGTARAAIAAALFAALAGTALVSYETARVQMMALDACEAVEAGDWDTALARTAKRSQGATGRWAAECRCLALIATDSGAECAELMEDVLAAPDAKDWAPNAILSVHLIQTWRDEGRTVKAADLARRASGQHPDNPDLFYLELVTRGSVEDEGLVLRELESRLSGGGPRELRMRSSLATRHLMRGDSHRALQVLGTLDSPDVEHPDDVARWFDTRAMAFAWDSDLEGVRRTYRAWERIGGDPVDLRARYALTLSMAGLSDPERNPIELLKRALSEPEGLDPRLYETLAIRLILTLVNAGRADEALVIYDHTHERFELAGLTRAELERAARHRNLAAEPLDTRRGTLRFAAPAGASGAQLWLSPEPGEPVDSDYERLPLSDTGRVTARRAFGIAPQRWVYRNAAGQTLASGTVSPVPGERVDVAITPGAPNRAERHDLSRLPGDGRRRIALLLLDCADWRLVQYLRARGELGFLDALIARGQRAVLESDPPLTAAALEALVWPGNARALSFLGLVHQMGVELAGLSSIGDNPFSALDWFLPERENLFSRLGAGPLSAANLLFAHGGVRAGHHAEITGPDGARRRVALTRSARDLNADERARFPRLARPGTERDRLLIRTLAAEFDTAEDVIRAGEVDLMALRIEPLDILTHAHFAETLGTGQDDGQRLLYSVYRYIDARLASVYATLDEDDVLIVMSDHGIRTAMEHSRQAIFVAEGPGIPAGRTPGQPSLAGVPRVLADLLGVSSEWPDSGLAPWARTVAKR